MDERDFNLKRTSLTWIIDCLCGTLLIGMTDFKKHGGVRERMHAARTEARGEAWDNAVYSMLNQAEDAADFEVRLAKIIDTARRTANNIQKRVVVQR